MINFGVGLPGPPVYGTTVEIENGPTLYWNGARWQNEPIYDMPAVLINKQKAYATDADHEAAAGYAAEVAASVLDSEQAMTTQNGYDSVVLRFRGGWPTATSREIMEEHLRRWFELFMEKQVDYGDRGDDLGLAGQYAEIHRKLGKLKRAMWDGEELAGEKMDEVLLDLIGHCFLSLRYIKHNITGGKGKK